MMAFPRICTAASLMAFALSTPLLAADPVAGTWKTQADDSGGYGEVAVSECGALVCGTLVQAYDKSGKALNGPDIGHKLIWDMKPKGGGAYADGKIWTPKTGKTYDASMQLDGNSLTVSGCEMAICRKQVWTRSK